MILSQLGIEIYYMWVWFVDLSIYTVVTLQQKSAAKGQAGGICNTHVTDSKIKVMCYTASYVYSDGV
jgi:hypothetical protein